MPDSIVKALAEHRDVAALIAALPATLRCLVEFDYMSLFLDGAIASAAGWYVPADADRPVVALISTTAPPIEAAQASWVIEHQQPAVSPQFGEATRAPGAILPTEQGFQSACAVPLTTPNRRLGSLYLAAKRPYAYSNDDLPRLSSLADHIAMVVDAALMHAELRQAYDEIRDLKDQLAQEKVYLEDEIQGDRNFEDIIGQSRALRRVLQQVEIVAPTDSTVLILGETGTGKELIARAIHNLSRRRPQPFVKLNCAAIPTGLLESELFGHERGAFTGAIAQRIGRFELANRGTVFLDEIGDIPLELQPKLLRVLQEREFERLGSGRTLRSDARLIAATNADLATLVGAQKFRADLFYRLNVFPIQVPPLRERVEDIPLLVRHFVQHFARQMHRTIDTISSDAMERLTRYPWPGNIRELENLIERAVILTAGPVLRVPLEDLSVRAAPTRVNGHVESRTLEEAEREHILRTVMETKWVLSGPRGAATRLGLNRSTLQFRMKKLGILRPGA